MNRSSPKPAVVKRRTLLSEDKRELMMVVLLRNIKAFETALGQLKWENFTGVSQPMLAIWKVLTEFYAVNNVLPSSEMLAVEIKNAVEIDPGLLNDPEMEAVDQFLLWAYSKDDFAGIETSPEYTEWALKVVKLVMEESLARDIKETVMNRDTMPVDFPDQARRITEEVEKIASFGATDSFLSFPDGWDQHVALNLFPTNIGFFDDFLGGGQADGEVYGLLGPFGSCKSTIGYMLSVNAAHTFYRRTKQPDYDGVPTISFVISYEDQISEMRARSIGYAATIPRATMEVLKNLSTDLGRSTTLRDYEKKKFARAIAAGRRVRGEYERAIQQVSILNDHQVMLDMTGQSRRGAGGGYVDEIAGTINSILRQRRAKCGLVVLDYVGAMVKRHMDSKNIPSDQLRHFIGGAALRTKHRICDVFHCPAWLLHQLSGAANNRKSTRVADHTDAAEAKNFAENLHFSFVIGKPDDAAGGLAKIACTKHRRQPGKSATIVKIDGAFNRVLCVDKNYTTDQASGRILSLDEARRLRQIVAMPPANTANTAAANPADLTDNF